MSILTEIGQQLYGDKFTFELSRALNLKPSILRSMIAGEIPIPDETMFDLIALYDAKKKPPLNLTDLTTLPKWRPKP